MMKLVWNKNGKPEWVTVTEMEDVERVARMQTYAEMHDRIELTCAVYGIPEQEHKYPVMPFLYEPKHGIDLAKRFDAEMAEIVEERNKAKARRVRKPDNRTRAERLADWGAEKDRRKDIHLDKIERDSRRRYGHGKTHYWDSNAERKICHAESVARADWELESAEIAEDEMIARFNAELEEFNRKWREEAEAEQNLMREYRKLRDLHEWLKYA